MSELSSIRTMQELEHHRALLRQKAANEERQVRQDIESIKRSYTTVTGAISSLRSGMSHLRLILPIALPILRFFWQRRRKKH